MTAAWVVVISSSGLSFIQQTIFPLPQRISTEYGRHTWEKRTCGRTCDPAFGGNRSMNLTAQTNADGNYFLERSIDRRTGSRVHNLCVEAIDDRIVVHGFADSYYAVQLAIAAIQEATQADANGHPIELDIQVARCPTVRAH